MRPAFNINSGTSVNIDQAVSLVGVLLTASDTLSSTLQLLPQAVGGAVIAQLNAGAISTGQTVAVYVPLPNIRVQAGDQLKNSGDAGIMVYTSATS